MNRRPVATVKLVGLGLTSDRVAAALEAAEKVAEAMTVPVDQADDAIFDLLLNWSPKPQRRSPYSPW